MNQPLSGVGDAGGDSSAYESGPPGRIPAEGLGQSPLKTGQDRDQRDFEKGRSKRRHLACPDSETGEQNRADTSAQKARLPVPTQKQPRRSGFVGHLVKVISSPGTSSSRSE